MQARVSAEFIKSPGCKRCEDGMGAASSFSWLESADKTLTLLACSEDDRASPAASTQPSFPP